MYYRVLSAQKGALLAGGCKTCPCPGLLLHLEDKWQLKNRKREREREFVLIPENSVSVMASLIFFDNDIWVS